MARPRPLVDGGAVVRRYFEVVLETGENTVVFHDSTGGGWFTQRGA